MSENSEYQGPAFFSYGFRPFFLGAAAFAGLVIPAWIFILARAGDSALFHTGREWHVHEMVFGFLPAVITGFLLTAIPNWTDHMPIRGRPLILLFTLWLAGRVAMVMPWQPPLAAALVDGSFLVLVAGLVWREIGMAKSWSHAPMGGLISLYAAANIVFHVLALVHAETEPATRMALTLVMLLLTLIGGRLTPNFTREFVSLQGLSREPARFSRVDGVAIACVGMAAAMWTVQPEGVVTGWVLVAAGLANVIRLSRWLGWSTWREPLVLILHIGYGWFAISLLALGGASLGRGLDPADAIHALTAGAVGAMTLAVMTRASLGHTGRPRHATPMTVLIYFLVNLGAILRVFGPSTGLPVQTILGSAGICWSGAYVLFAVIYGRFLIQPSLEE